MNTNYLAHLASETSLALVLQQAGLSANQNILLCLVDMWLDKVLCHLNLLIFSAFCLLFTNLLVTTIGAYICIHVSLYLFLFNQSAALPFSINELCWKQLFVATICSQFRYQ